MIERPASVFCSIVTRRPRTGSFTGPGEGAARAHSDSNDLSDGTSERRRDAKRKKLEEQVSELVAGLIKAAAIEKELERVRTERSSSRNREDSGSRAGTSSTN